MTWVSSYDIDPFDVSAADRAALLWPPWTTALLDQPGSTMPTPRLRPVQENKFYADLAGTTTTQQRVRVHPTATAVSINRDDGRVRVDAHAGPACRPGLGVPDRNRLGLGPPSWPSSPSCWPRKLAAPTVEAGRYDLVIDPSNLWLTIHESIGHATELDRALGYEAAYAGTSFATFDLLGTLQYGSPSCT